MPLEASPRRRSGLTPAPIMARDSSKGTGSISCRPRTTLSVSIRSGAVSMSVPSRSKTTVGDGMAERYLERGHEARQGALADVHADPYFPSLAAARGARYGQASHLPKKPASCRLPMNAETYKREAAAGALDFVEPGTRLGLGTGSTARPFVELLGERVRAGLDVVAVPTSEATRAQAEQCGIRLTTLDDTPELDLTIDGADEISPDLTLIKGGGGALLREKTGAAASARMIVIADESKWVAILGRFALPIEV